MKSLDLEGAIADLQHGSINCICFNGCMGLSILLVLVDFIISVSGVLTVGQEKRNFSHVFVLSELSDEKKESHVKKCIFFVRAEILTFHHVSDGELSIDVCEETQGISFTSLPERADETYASSSNGPASDSTSNATAPATSRQSNNHAGQQKYKQHRTDHYYTNRRNQRRPEGNDDENDEKSDQDQTPKIFYEM